MPIQSTLGVKVEGCKGCNIDICAECKPDNGRPKNDGDISVNNLGPMTAYISVDSRGNVNGSQLPLFKLKLSANCAPSKGLCNHHGENFATLS